MRRKKEKLLYYFFFIITIIALIILLKIIKIFDIFCYIFDIISPIALGYVFSWLLLPIYKKVNTRLNKKLSLLIIIFLITVTYSLIGYLVIPLIFKSLPNLLNILKKYILKLKTLSFLKIDESLFMMKPKDFIDSCGGVISIVINTVLIHIFGIYFLYNYEIISMYVKERIPTKYKQNILDFINKLSFNMRLYIKGLVIDTAILFFITFITFSIIRLKYALLLSIFIAITNVIPFIGPYIGGIPSVLIALNKSKKHAIFLVAFLFISQEVESDIINPMIMSKCVKINPLLIVITVTIAGKIFGIIGMIFAIPIVIFIKLLAENITNIKKDKTNYVNCLRKIDD